ncbi:MAG: Hsp20/alpha crystallin family protein [Polyangiaceae bacterium]
MFTHFQDLDRTFSLFDQMDRIWNDRTGRERVSALEYAQPGAGPGLYVHDTESALIVVAEVPGLRENDISIMLHEGVLTISGERKADAPEGYRAHTQERAAYKFSRSLSLPTKVDADNVTATVKAGLLTIELPKAAEAKPRQIAVKTPS